MPLAQKNQTPAIPSSTTKRVMAIGVSMEKFVAAIEIPRSHQAICRRPTKKSSTERPARLVSHMPAPKIATKYVAMTT